MDQRGHTLIIGIIIGLLLAGGLFGAYYLGSQTHQNTSSESPAIISVSPQPTSPLLPSPNPTANWETYTNSSYHFSFKYPQDWHISLDQPNLVYVNSPTNFALIINYKTKGDSKKIVRSSVGAGDLISRGTVKFADQMVSRDILIYQNQDKGILYNKSKEITVSNLVFSINIDNLRSAAAGYPTLDNQTEDQADQILSTFTFAN